MPKKIARFINSYILAYYCGTLPLAARVLVRLWLFLSPQSRSDAERASDLIEVIRYQPEIPAPAHLLPQIHSRIEPRANSKPAESGRNWILLPASIGMGILAAILLWQAFPPINNLEWSIRGVTPSVFRIYRATVDNKVDGISEDFVLLDEVQASKNNPKYYYRDYLFLSSGDFVYRVEAIDSLGNETGNSELFVSSGWLPGQLFGFVAILLFLLGIWIVFDRLLNRKNGLMLHIYQLI